MFESEKKLVDQFKGSAKKFLCQVSRDSKSPFFLIEEFDSHHGIADLVLGTFKNNLYFQTPKLRKSINWDWIQPLMNLKRKSTLSTLDFMDIYGVSEKTAKVRLNEYYEAGFIQHLDGNNFIVVQSYRPVTKLIVSIEAKLRHWKKALQQAYRYKRFSHYSFVLIDEAYVRPALKQIDLFKKLGIGLISMDDENYQIHFRPSKKKLSQNHSYLRLNEAVFDYFKLKSASS